MKRVEKLYIALPGAPPGSPQAYALAALMTAGATALRLAMDAWLTGVPFIVYFPTIVLVTLLLGARAGALAAVLSTLCAWWFILPGGPGLTPHLVLGLFLFALVGASLVGLLSALRYSIRRYQALNAELEARVEQRTADLARVQAELVQAHKMEAVGQLTGGVAHDFNNMLAVIVGSLELAQRRQAAGRLDIGDQIQHALDAARRAAALTQRLLAFARRQPLAPKVVDVNRLVSATCELLRSTLGRDVQIECVLSGGLWRTSVDPAQLDSALVNLAVNARDAMPEGGKLTVETANAHLDEAYVAAHPDVRPGQYVLIAVTDTGCGMAPEVAERVFEPFFTTKEVGRGTGLGLSQVYGFVKQSGGHIKVYSEAGQGTTVRIYLPRWLGAEAGAEAGEATAKLLPAAVGEGQVVLVVEDEPQVRQITIESLKELGYHVLAAGSGAEALALLESGARVDLLFTDVVMPGMSGRELAERVAVLRPGLRVLFATGYTRNAVVHNGTVDPDVQLLSKPFSLDQLARKLGEALG